MTLRYRMVLFEILTLVVLVSCIYVFYPRLSMQSYNQLERQDAEQNTDRARRAVEELDDSLHDKSVDWSNWDDTYKFMADHNQAYIKSNLVAESVGAMKLDIILYVDNQGRLFHQFADKRCPGLPVPNAVVLWRSLHLDHPDAVALGAANGCSGLILHPNCPLLVSVRPISDSKGTAPRRGWLVFGRYFDGRELHSLADRTRLNVHVFRVDSPGMSPQDQQMLAALQADARTRIRPLDTRTILGYTLMPDVHQRPALLLKIALPRHIHWQGLAGTSHMVRLIFIASLVFSVVTLLVIEISVLSRLTRLTRQVGQIGVDENDAMRVHLGGRDELGSLATQINGMLKKLEISAAALHRSEEALRLQNERLEETVMERTQEILHQALHDSLTGLPNRAQAIYYLQQLAEMQPPPRTAVLFLDLDNFKFVNDSLGHGAGDELLRGVAERFLTCVGPRDIVARFGGDEFVIVLESVESRQAAIEVVQRVLTAMRARFALTNGVTYAATSVGIACSDGEPFEPDVLLRNADTAMYHAKSSGKSAYAVFHPDMNDRLTERVEMEVGLRLALEHDQLRVHYQPLVDLQTGHLAGVEALVRWQHPEKGLIPPGKFIPIAEETGLIIPLGYWVLEESCRQAVIWKQAYPEHGAFVTNVNLSGKQLQKPDVVDRVREILEKTGLAPHFLKLEITESVMMEDAERAVEKLAQLKSLGVKLALDDFGTGYSSMASLSSFPLDTVKIDRAFISRLGADADADAVVSAMILLAKSLLFDVTGEGIETSEQLLSLQSLGCDIGQGYLFAKALESADLEDRMNQPKHSFVKCYSDSDRELIERLLAGLEVNILEDLPDAA